MSLLDHSRRDAARALAVVGLVLTAACLASPALAQFGVSDFQARPFVTGITPVIGPGGTVGGVSIDAQGLVSRSTLDQTTRLRDARIRALTEIDASLDATSRMRKVSLRGLIAALQNLSKSGQPITPELQNLAGQTRVEFVLLYPDERDIVLAGPAEGWKIDDHGNVVGRESDKPVLQLDDLVVALRAAREQVKTGELITCSIDPSEEGSKRFARLVNSRDWEVTKANVARLEEVTGPQHVTVTGVPPGSRFAHVLVAADFLMKRLGMNFEPAPVDGLPSYLDMLKDSKVAATGHTTPRWWMTPRYEPLLRDADSLAWQLRGSGVQTLSEDGLVSRRAGPSGARGKEDSLAKKWADAMTSKYDALAKELPIFAQLRNCMDLAVVGALFVKEDLPGRAGCDLGLLLDPKLLTVAEHHVPKTIDSRASLLRKDRQWIISVSGGVELDSWSVLEKVEQRHDLAEVRTTVAAARPDRWWWD